MPRVRWILLRVAMIAAVIGSGAHALAHAGSWTGTFSLLVALSLVSFLYEHREHCGR